MIRGLANRHGTPVTNQCYMPTKLFRTLSSLRKRWPRLNPVQRADEIYDLVERGLTRRGLARELGISEGQVRQLQLLHNSSESIRHEVRDRQRSVRSALAVAMSPKSKKEEILPPRPPATTLEPTVEHAPAWAVEPQAAADLIIDFLRNHCGLTSVWAAQVAEQAKRKIMQASKRGELDHLLVKNPRSAERIIEACRPKYAVPEEQEANTGYAIDWLARWGLCLLPREIRSEAFDIARNSFRGR